MVALKVCPACAAGDHDNCNPAWGRLSDELLAAGVCGGFACACPGDCPPPEDYATEWFFENRAERCVKSTKRKDS